MGLLRGVKNDDRAGQGRGRKVATSWLASLETPPGEQEKHDNTDDEQQHQ